MSWGLHALPKILLVVFLAYVLLKVLHWACRRLIERAHRRRDTEHAQAAREHEKRTETLIGIVRRAGKVTIGLFIAMLLLVQVGIDIAPLIAGAGIVGLAVGFGAQELVRDVISGFFILFENQIRKGDGAVINGETGTVEDIGLRTITLRDLSGTVHIFQNGKIESLSNMTKGWSAAVLEIRVAEEEDTDEVATVMRDVGAELRADSAFADKILEPLEILGVESFGEGVVVLKARIKTQPSEQWAVAREYRRRLKKMFDANDVDTRAAAAPVAPPDPPAPRRLGAKPAAGVGRR